jgi:WD40 repeat protein
MSPDGSYVITASLDKTAKLVDLVMCIKQLCVVTVFAASVIHCWG